MRRIRAWLAIGSVALIACQPHGEPESHARATTAEKTAPGEYATTIDLARRAGQRLIDSGEVRGLSVALVEGERVVFSAGFGKKWAEGGAVEPDTVFRVGSLAKPVLAAAVMQNVERGDSSLDDALAGYPGNPEQGEERSERERITIRHVLTQQAGLPADDLSLAWPTRERAWDLIKHELDAVEPVHPPGRVLSYSNLGYAMLGRTLEQRTGTPFAEHMKEALFEPLGMKGASYGLLPEEAAEAVMPQVEPGLLPATGLNASATDLAHFASMILNRGQLGDMRLLSRNSVDEMLRAQNDGSSYDFRTRVGLGWILTHLELPGLDVVWHDGEVPGYLAQMLLLPRRGLAVIVLSTPTGNGADVRQLAAALTRSLAHEQGVEMPPISRPESNPELDPVADATGVYALQDGIARVHRVDDQLQIESAYPIYPGFELVDGVQNLEPVGTSRYRVATSPLVLEFGQVDDVVMMVGERDRIHGRLAERFDPGNLSPAWSARVGDWRPQRIDLTWVGFEEVRLVIEDGVLLLRYDSEWEAGVVGTRALIPLDDSTAVIAGLGRGKGELVRFESRSGAEIMHWQGLKLRADGD